MKRSKKAAAVLAMAAGMAVAGAQPALADIPGEAVYDATGSGLLVNPTVIGGDSSIQVCATATLHGTGPLATSIALVVEGVEHYGGDQANPLYDAPTPVVSVFGSTATICSRTLPLHPGASSTYALEFEVSANGTLLLGGSFQGTCAGTALRVQSGVRFVLNPCEFESPTA
ncbi:MAG TPA: hypothetical protein VGX28_09665 [Frankiaceae bacterium]|jgi:hypothetical protein|nr:hypothetical protein [Frankiaceae bacterium]